ncbi:MAG: hypothetical protein RIC80_12110 [Cyclobacteriaceae bacterium]
MAILQMRDLPDELYEKLKVRAKEERRSIMQQAVVLLEEALSEDHNKTRRKRAIQAMIDSKVDLKKPDDIVAMIREDRER